MCEIENLKELQKQEAMKRLELLELFPNVITDFEKFERVYYSERQNKVFDGILYWVSNEPQFVEAIKEFEEKHNALVYHAQLTHFEFGTCLSMLFVSQYQEEWEMERNDIINSHDGIMYLYAYVANLTEPEFSEIGRIGIIRKNGGLSRVY